MSKIEWTKHTWNPLTGCDKISPGCKNCYAEKMANRLKLMGSPNYANGFKLTLQPNMLDVPLKRNKPTIYFVNSMSDLFHEDVPDEWIDTVFAIIARCPQHIFQILTKRPERMRDYFQRLIARQADPYDIDLFMEVLIDYKAKFGWKNTVRLFDTPIPFSNVWLGVSVENQKTADERIPFLLQTPAAIRFLSCEPLLEQVNLSEGALYGGCQYCNFTGYIETNTPAGIVQCSCAVPHLRDESFAKLDWVIVGGESGPKSRPCSLEWIDSIVRQCKKAGVKCFVKQLGAFCVTENVNIYDYEKFKPWGTTAASARIVLKNRKGADISEFPSHLQIREYPQSLNQQQAGN